MGITESKLQNNTYRALSKLFLQNDSWTKLQLQGVLMDMDEVLAGGRAIQKWLDAKVAMGFLLKSEDGVYTKVKKNE